MVEAGDLLMQRCMEDEYDKLQGGSQDPGAWNDTINNEPVWNGRGKGVAKIPFTRRGNSAYVIVEGRTWEEAEANAIQLGGHLVTINDKAENDFIVNVLQPIIWARYGRYVSQNPARYGGPNHPYIGYSDVKNEGTWVWSSGQTSSFQNWSPSEPSSDVSNADYAQIYLVGETSTGVWGQWDDFAEFKSGSLYNIGIAEIPLIPKPTYKISTSTTLIDEGTNSSVRTTITTTGVNSGTRLYYTATGSGINSSDFTTGDIKGSRLVNSDGTATFLHTFAADETTEGSESFTIKLYTDWARTNLVATSDSISISDTSKTPAKPTYSLSLTPHSISEGDAFRASIVTTDLADGTTLYYAIQGDVDADDFTGNAGLTGRLMIDSSGQASFTRKTLADKLTEGLETARVLLYSDLGRSLQLAGPEEVKIRDTSTAPAKPTYSLSLTPDSIDEGEAFRASITTKYLDPGTRLYYTIKGDVNSSDFIGKKLEGSLLIDNKGLGSLTYQTKEDQFTEGVEKAEITLYSDYKRTLPVSSKTLRIRDTSLTPKNAKYAISFNHLKLEEGDPLSTTVKTKNVDPGTTLFWSFIGDGITFEDFSKGETSGFSTVNKKGGFSLRHTLAEDLKSEGKEKMTLKLFSDDYSNSAIASSSTISILDTSTNKQPPTPAGIPTPTPEPTPTGAPPNLVKATLRGKNITLQFDNALSDTLPSIGRFTLNQSKREYRIVDTEIKANDGTVELTAEKELDPTASLTLDYIDFPGDQTTGVIESSTGVDLESFTGFKLEQPRYPNQFTNYRRR